MARRGEDDVFILDIPRETLERAPGFDKDNPPDMSGREYAQEIYVFYGYAPYW